MAACSDDATPPIGPGTTGPVATSPVATSPVTTTPVTTTPVTTSPATTIPVTTTPVTTTPVTTSPLPSLQGLQLEVVGDGYANPVFVTSPPGDDRLFVVEKPGRIRIIGVEAPFLDVTALTAEDHQEQGLLGLAFHPDYAANGRFFVYYTDRGGTSTLAEYAVSAADRDAADPGSAEILLTQEQPKGNHNGGMLAFGPDGRLYLGLGDGGGANDRYGNGQRPDTLLGAILRLDVDAATPYAIPPDNPFVDGGGAPEVWAYGLRNPWRFSFDGGLLYVADVGQAAWEEIDVAPAASGGLNYGWPIMEGEACFQEAGCDAAGLEAPVIVYSHDEGCSVTGGYVYRGAAIPEIDGHYFYADWCGGWVRSIRYQDGAITDASDWTGDLGSLDQIVSFGRDAAGELYVVVQGGTIYRIVPIR
ncbi:MAG: PQQ-dependent sugar dehydrogenase [Actinobacteria bacterium]|nr:PQQ-dependent sugar dehydrogenase [Actinomycetota bacterium]